MWRRKEKWIKREGERKKNVRVNEETESDARRKREIKEKKWEDDQEK